MYIRYPTKTFTNKFCPLIEQTRYEHSISSFHSDSFLTKKKKFRHTNSKWSVAIGKGCNNKRLNELL